MCVINKRGEELFYDSIFELKPIMGTNVKYIVRSKNGFGLLDSTGNGILEPINEKTEYCKGLFVDKVANCDFDIYKEARIIHDDNDDDFI